MSKSKSKKIAEKTIYAALSILKENGGEMRGKDVLDRNIDTVAFDDYEKHNF